jgi:hypothetical protein
VKSVSSTLLERYGMQPYAKKQYLFVPGEFEYYLTILTNTNLLSNPEVRNKWTAKNLKSLMNYPNEKREKMREAMNKKREQMKTSTKVSRTEALVLYR